MASASILRLGGWRKLAHGLGRMEKSTYISMIITFCISDFTVEGEKQQEMGVGKGTGQDFKTKTSQKHMPPCFDASKSNFMVNSQSNITVTIIKPMEVT